VLEKFGWEPESLEDRVHFLIAKMDEKGLRKIWPEASSVLLHDLQYSSTEPLDERRRENAVHALILWGKEETETHIEIKKALRGILLSHDEDKALLKFYIKHGILFKMLE